MSTVLSILAFFVVAFIAVLAIIVIVVKRKLRKGVAWGEVKLLELAVKDLKEKQGKASEADQALNDLVARGESALAQAKTALQNGDLKAVTNLTMPVLTEIGQRIQKAAEEAKAAQAAPAAEAGTVIEATKPVALLEAPSSDEKKQ